MANSVTVVTASIVFIVSIIGLWSKVEDIDLPKSIVIECDFYSAQLKFAIYCTLVVWLLYNIAEIDYKQAMCVC